MKLATGLALAALIATPALADFNDAPPNVPSQKPAFEGQTRAPVLPAAFELTATKRVDGLSHPWGMAILPDGAVLVTERPGQLRLIGTDGTLGAPIAGLPPVDAREQGGLLDVAIGPNFASDRQIWWSFAEPQADGTNNTAVATGTLSADNSAVENVRTIFSQQPSWDSTKHFGSRLVFDRDGMLFVTTGERSEIEARPLAQDLTTHLGKLLRIDPQTGAAAPGNPTFTGVEAKPEIWSYGHRSLQGATLDAQGRLWTVEHGPQGGDELNRPEAGKNYGWPTITYGEEYAGTPIGEGLTQQDGMEQPLYYWDPVIAPSGMSFYDGAMFPEMKGDLLIGGLRGQALVQLRLDGDKVVGEQRYLQDEIGRIRDLEVAPDGSIYLLTDEDNGGLYQVTRK